MGLSLSHEPTESPVLLNLLESLRRESSEHDLFLAFALLNERFFLNTLPEPRLSWNSRFRSVAGRFTPSPMRDVPQFAMVEVASYLKSHERGAYLILDTLGHELIHYWLWLRRRPYGHTEEFYKKMREMGVSRYNSNPVSREYRHVYRCRSCAKDVYTRKRIRKMACAACCKRYNRGYYDTRFALDWVGFYGNADDVRLKER